jgi:hypothetical protein
MTACGTPGVLDVRGGESPTPTATEEPEATEESTPMAEPVPGCTQWPGPIGLQPSGSDPAASMVGYVLGSDGARICDPGGGLSFAGFVYSVLLDDSYDELCVDVSWMIASLAPRPPDFQCGAVGCNRSFRGVTASERETSCNYNNPMDWFTPWMMAGFFEGVGFGPYDPEQPTGYDPIPTFGELMDLWGMPADGWAIEHFLWTDRFGGEPLPFGVVLRNLDQSNPGPPATGLHRIVVPFML